MRRFFIFTASELKGKKKKKEKRIHLLSNVAVTRQNPRDRKVWGQRNREKMSREAQAEGKTVKKKIYQATTYLL